MIDTHTHLYMPEFEDEADAGRPTGSAAVDRAIAAGVSHMVFPNVDLSTIAPMRALAAAYPDSTSMAMGLHPTEVKTDWQDVLPQILAELNRGDYVAVGEVGIDLYWDKTFEAEQMQVFDLQAAEAKKRSIPLIIHCRDGLDQALEVLEGHPNVSAIFHSFGGSAADVDRIRRVGDYYFGINGIVTFKNCNVRDAISEITLDRLVLETDSPYLAPVPKRGKRNESAYLPHIAAHIANHLGVPIDQLKGKRGPLKT